MGIFDVVHGEQGDSIVLNTRDVTKPDDEYQWLECTRHDMIGAECLIDVAPGGFCNLGSRRRDG